jgi:hypothetical protein
MSRICTSSSWVWRLAATTAPPIPSGSRCAVQGPHVSPAPSCSAGSTSTQGPSRHADLPHGTPEEHAEPNRASPSKSNASRALIDATTEKAGGNRGPKVAVLSSQHRTVPLAKSAQVCWLACPQASDAPLDEPLGRIRHRDGDVHLLDGSIRHRDADASRLEERIRQRDEDASWLYG